MKNIELEEKKLLLGRYRDTERKYRRRGEDAERWRDMAIRAGTSVARTDRRDGQPRDTVGHNTTMADTIEQECRQLEAVALSERKRLCTCIDLMPLPEHREILESIYVSGKTITQLAAAAGCSEKTIERKLKRAVVSLEKHSDYFEVVPVCP